MKLMFTFLIFLLSLNLALPQEEIESQLNLLPQGLSFSNQLRYSYDQHKKIEILEDWLNLDYRYNIFSAGIRLETFQPKDYTIAGAKRRFSEINFKYISAEIGDGEKGLEITAGNFYSLFGRGLILKSYEDRNLRVDNNLLGLKIVGTYSGFVLTALTGMLENFDGSRSDVLHAIDLESRIIKQMKFGFSFASNQPALEEAARTSLLSFRINPSIWNLDIYAEYGIKQNLDDKKKYFNNERAITGRALYSQANFYLGSFSISGEYKYYDNFAFTTYEGTASYNLPPSTRKDYTYISLNSHPSPLNPSNEKGFQVEMSYDFGDENFLNATYGLTRTLSSNSLFQIANKTNLPERTQLKEFFIQGQRKWNEAVSTIIAFGYNEELDGNTKNVTPIIESRYYFDEINTIRFVFEHQWTTNRATQEQYYVDVLTLEYLRAPKLSIALVSEMQTSEPTKGRKVRRLWNLIQFGYKIGEHTDINLLVGSRQAGNICIGGVCRYEPEFSGVEIKMLTRL
ncbi:MAG: DUF6029 family protein [Ignavibacteria bacterium]|nr:DUF6029 family protein [Ignavibacteria bacterium]